MNTIDFFLVFSLTICLALVAYAYLGYPIVVWILSKCFGREHARPDVSSNRLPPVSLLIVAHNEQEHIECRILNALAADYPPELLEIVIASDGSDDRTN